MEKPIHREIRGEMIIMDFMLALFPAWAACWLTALVFMEIKENTRLEPADTTGSRNRAKPPATVQNFRVGIRARSTRPRKSKLTAKIRLPTSPTAALTASRFSGVIREDR